MAIRLAPSISNLLINPQAELLSAQSYQTLSLRLSPTLKPIQSPILKPVQLDHPPARHAIPEDTTSWHRFSLFPVPSQAQRLYSTIQLEHPASLLVLFLVCGLGRSLQLVPSQELHFSRPSLVLRLVHLFSMPLGLASILRSLSSVTSFDAAGLYSLRFALKGFSPVHRRLPSFCQTQPLPGLTANSKPEAPN